jgi:inorganic pyrophosphatase
MDTAESDRFWSAVSDLVASSDVIVDRPRGSRHPRIDEFMYPVNYGFLAGTVSGDGEGIDVWIGDHAGAGLVGAYITCDPYARNIEPKLAVDVSSKDLAEIDKFYSVQPQSAIYVPRPPTLPRTT